MIVSEKERNEESALKKKWIISLVVIILMVMITGLVIANQNKKQLQQEEKNLKIVTSFYPIYIMSLNITQGAQNIELVNMAETNVGCLHDYTLSTNDMKKIENADVFIENGLGLESFNDKIIRSPSKFKNN